MTGVLNITREVEGKRHKIMNTNAILQEKNLKGGT